MWASNYECGEVLGKKRNGKWRMENGEWRMENGELSIPDIS